MRRPKASRVNSRQVGAINRSILLRTVVASTHIPAVVTQKSGLVVPMKESHKDDDNKKRGEGFIDGLLCQSSSRKFIVESAFFLKKKDKFIKCS